MGMFMLVVVIVAFIVGYAVVSFVVRKLQTKPFRPPAPPPDSRAPGLADPAAPGPDTQPRGIDLRARQEEQLRKWKEDDERRRQGTWDAKR